MKPEDPLARAERITAELRAVTTEAAGILADLQRTMKQAREQVDGYYSQRVKATLDAHTVQWDRQCFERIQAMVREVNEVAGRAAARAESAIDRALAIDEAANHLAALLDATAVDAPGGRRLQYGTLTNPDKLRPRS